MTSKELRQAAERILTSCSTRFGEGVFSLASHILATVQEDGEEILTAEWLIENYIPDYKGCRDVSVVAAAICMKSRQAIPTTRSQFRSLMTGLGIEPLSKLVKPLDYTGEKQ